MKYLQKPFPEIFLKNYRSCINQRVAPIIGGLIVVITPKIRSMHSADAPKILIIDDEVDICFLLSNLLKKKNFQTQSAFDIHQAKLALVHYTPTIVFLDNHLTDGLGMNFIPYLKQACPEAKIIMITAYDDKESQEEAFNKGVDDFVSKPLRWDILNAAIEKVLNKSTLVAS